jgi:hypothetical protein
MGDPVECEHTEPGTGDAYQQTTTGLALYRRETNTSMFTNGREQWALTPFGLAQWSGWHGSTALLRSAEAVQVDEVQQTAAPPGPYLKVEAVTIVDVLDDSSQHLVVRRQTTPYLIETEAECAAVRPLIGDVIFVLSSDEFAGADSRVMLTLGARDCRIIGSRPL